MADKTVRIDEELADHLTEKADDIIAGNHNTTKMAKKAFIRLKLERKFRNTAYKT